jgi:hypothetical protein
MHVGTAAAAMATAPTALMATVAATTWQQQKQQQESSSSCCITPSPLLFIYFIYHLASMSGSSRLMISPLPRYISKLALGHICTYTY